MIRRTPHDRRDQVAVVMVLVAVLGAATLLRLADSGSGSGSAPSSAAVGVRVAGISVERTAEQRDAANRPAANHPAANHPAADRVAADRVAAANSDPAFAESSSTVTSTERDQPIEPVPAELAELRAQVLAQITYPWQERLPGWRIEFVAPRAGYRGSTFPKQLLIEIYVRDDLSFDDLVHTTAHELGHAIDVSMFDAADHERWNVARGRAADADWWASSGADDFSTGAGDWAESFAWSQMPRGRWYSRVGPPPTADELRIVDELVGQPLVQPDSQPNSQPNDGPNGG